MNPLSPNQILRNLENGFFMTHKEQEEAAQYIRELQKEVETLSVAKFHLESELDKTQDSLNDCLVEKHFKAKGVKWTSE